MSTPLVKTPTTDRVRSESNSDRLGERLRSLYPLRNDIDGVTSFDRHLSHGVQLFYDMGGLMLV